MKLGIEALLNDRHLDGNRSTQQRQLSISVSAIADAASTRLPLNLCLVLDRSGSMRGKPMETVREAALRLIDQLTPQDRLSLVSFNHEAEVVLANDRVEDRKEIATRIENLVANGGTAIDEGLKLGIEEAAKGKQESVSQIFLLTDGENEHGDNDRCFKFAEVASQYNITLNALGFGSFWNQDVLEKIADTAGGALAFIEKPEQAIEQFSRLFNRIQAVGLTNAYLFLELAPQVRLAELKPIAQVAPETIELPVVEEGDRFMVRLGDISTATPRVVLANLYIAQLPPGEQVIARVQVRYNDPASHEEGLFSEPVPVSATVQENYQSAPDERVQKSVLALAKYRQTQLAETKLQAGDTAAAATLLQTAAQTALQLGDREGSTVLQDSSTCLQAGGELSEEERKKTRIVSKTILQ